MKGVRGGINEERTGDRNEKKKSGLA